ncbi:hypothetical protein [Roseitalea porphyridii]|uniref:Uncharacterized protein n=1 Tax=Roseitalea porphyridii TaxID=1852022 RepID=A0A4P6UZN2_9HYPH|nr:hypothetical protein [Roseitalea porphyridii]QBK29794.1 hypothetical protein E0E05_03770 [Roseitalea porphyridii]
MKKLISILSKAATLVLAVFIGVVATLALLTTNEPIMAVFAAMADDIPARFTVDCRQDASGQVWCRKVSP